MLSNLVAEVAFGITRAQGTLVESPVQKQEDRQLKEAREEEEESRRKKALETKRKMLNAIGDRKLANVFEGTEPLKSSGTPGSVSAQSPLSGRDPNDAGVDISGLFSLAGKKWNTLK